MAVVYIGQPAATNWTWTAPETSNLNSIEILEMFFSNDKNDDDLSTAGIPSL